MQNSIPFKFPLKALAYAGLLLSHGAAVVQAADDTEFFLEVRERLEHQENLNDKFYGLNPKTGEASDSYLLSRIRVGLTHNFNEHFKGKISLQDSRAIDWGFQDSDWSAGEFGGIENNPQHDPLELGETWLEYQNGLMTAKVGRQAIAYGNNRVFGPGAWKNSGKWVWDAAKLRLKHNQHWLDAFYGKTMLHDPNSFSLSHRHGFTGSGLYGHLQLHDSLTLEPMFITKYNDASNDYAEKDLYYIGARTVYQANGWKLDATYLQQSGDVYKNNGTRTQADAQGMNLDIHYRFNPQWLVGTTYAFASGDDKSTPENERFDGVYGASDKYYGRMNVMAWSNLSDFGVLGNYRPHRDWELQVEYHQFYADQIDDAWRAYKTGLNADSKHYGDEVDLTATYKLNPQWVLMAGAGAFMPGKAIRQAVDNNQAFLTDDIAYSGFMQATYKFKHTF